MRLTVMYNQAQALRKWNKKKYSHHVHWDTKAWVRSVLIRLVSWSSAWRKFWLTLVKTFVKMSKMHAALCTEYSSKFSVFARILYSVFFSWPCSHRLHMKDCHASFIPQNDMNVCCCIVCKGSSSMTCTNDQVIWLERYGSLHTDQRFV